MNQSSNPIASYPVIGSASHPGKVRAVNEDRFYVPPQNLSPQLIAAKGYLCLIADGMGGHARGDVAAETAARRVAEVYYADPETDVEQSLRHAIQTANADVFVASQNPGMQGMGTTVVAFVVAGSGVTIANVGDSRAYLVSRGQALQVTHDHSVVQNLVDGGVITLEQAEQHPERNKILRAVGIKPSVEVDMFTPAAEPGDTIVLCSDGLSNLVRQEEIARVASSMPPQPAAEQLVKLANERGGHDNITVVVARVAPNAASARSHPARSSALVPILVGVMTALFLGVFAIVAFLSNQRSQPAVALSQPTGPAIAAPTPSVPAVPSPLPPATATRAVPPTPTSMPTQIPTRTATPAPTVPKGEIVYVVPEGTNMPRVIAALGIASDSNDFHARHKEIWCTTMPPGNPTCIKAGANLILKWEELNPVVGLPVAQSQPNRMLWMAVLVNDDVLQIPALGKELAPHTGKPVLIRGKWRDGVWVDDPAVNVMFVWYPQSNRYGQIGRAAPPVATSAPTKESGREIPIEPLQPGPQPQPPQPEPQPQPPEPPVPPPPPEPK